MRSIVWKVNLVFIAVIAVVIGFFAFDSNRIYERDALQLARKVSKSQLETIRQSLRKLMIDRDTAGIKELIDNLARSDPLYGDIRLVSHEGNVVASRVLAAAPLDLESRPCAVCHALEDPARGIEITSYEEVVELASGARAVSVVAPILNEQSCSNNECHAHPPSERVLGLLQASFSLENLDQLISQRNYYAMLVVGLAVALSIIATRLILKHFVGDRFATLSEGMKRVAESDFSFRFDDPRKDEIGALSVSFDSMTDRLSSTLKTLQDTKDYLEGIVENSADIIITVDPEGLIRTFNKGAENQLGYQRDEVIGRKIEILFADPRERDAAITRLADTDNVANYETHFLTRQGEVRDVILTLSRLRSPDGSSIGTFGISKDVTREKRLQRELISKEKLAAIGQAVTGIQHSLKNMLNSLRGGAYMVETGFEDDDRHLLEEGWAMVQEGIACIMELSTRMLHYVSDWKPEIEETDLSKLLESTYRVSKETARSQGIEFRTDIARDLPSLLCDPRLIHSAVLDLLSNAFDACLRKDYGELEHPKVLLKADCPVPKDKLVIEVQDNGEGMAVEIQNSIFVPFFSTKRSIGTGIGLTLTSRIIRLHGGTIEFKSEPSIGTVFKVSLPVSGPKLVEGKKEDCDA